MSWKSLSLSAAVLGLAIGAGAAPLAALERLSLTYKTQWNGIDLAETHVEAELEAGRYALSMVTDTVGVGAWFADGHTEARASGRFGSGMVSPDQYETQGTWDQEKYRRFLEFDQEGHLVHQEADIPQEWTERWPRADVPAEARVGPDPLSLLMMLAIKPLPAVGEGLALRSFDGSVVLESQISCEAPAEGAAATVSAALSGPQRLCTLGWETIEGHRIQTEADRKAQNTKQNQRKRRGGGQAARKKAQEQQNEPLTVTMQSGLTDAAGTNLQDMPIPLRLDLQSSFGRFEVILEDVSFERGTEAGR